MTAYGRRLVDQFDSASETCSTLSDLADLIAAAAHEMGFAHFALLHHVSLFAPSAGVVRLDTYPEDWTAELVSSHLGSIDPVHHACTRTNLGFAWERLGELTPIGPHEREMLVRARRFGLADGFTVPINIPGEPTGSCTFVVRAGKDLPRARLLGAEQIGAHAFDVARRLVGLAGPTRGARLTPRER